MNPLGLIFGGIAEAIKTLGTLWLEKKKAQVEGEIALNKAVVSGEIDYDVAAQQAGATSWKDEWLTLWTTGVVTCCFIPSLQVYIKSGFAIMATLPAWFTWCFVGMYVAVFGLKGWKMFQNGRNGK